jgi:hypothetical protein
MSFFSHYGDYNHHLVGGIENDQYARIHFSREPQENLKPISYNRASNLLHNRHIDTHATYPDPNKPNVPVIHHGLDASNNTVGPPPTTYKYNDYSSIANDQDYQRILNDLYDANRNLHPTHPLLNDQDTYLNTMNYLYPDTGIALRYRQAIDDFYEKNKYNLNNDRSYSYVRYRIGKLKSYIASYVHKKYLTGIQPTQPRTFNHNHLVEIYNIVTTNPPNGLIPITGLTLPPPPP